MTRASPLRRAGRRPRDAAWSETSRQARAAPQPIPAGHAAQVGSKLTGTSGGVADMSEVVYKHIEDGVAVITLNRPERLNAWTTEMEHAYFAMLEECGAVGGGARDRRDRRRTRVLRGRRHARSAGARRRHPRGLRADLRAPPAELPAVDPQADHRRDQRRLCRHRTRAGADVRHALRRRGSQADDRLRPPRADRRARHLLDAAAPDRARTRTRPAAVRSRRARRGGSRHGARQPCAAHPSCCSSRRSTTRASCR